MNVDLRSERINRGLGMTEAAKRMDVHVSILARAEAGISQPHPKNALKIARFFGYQVTDVWPLPDEDEEPQRQAVGS